MIVWKPIRVSKAKAREISEEGSQRERKSHGRYVLKQILHYHRVVVIMTALYEIKTNELAHCFT